MNCASSGTLVPPQGVVMPPLGDVNLIRWLFRDWCPEPFAATGPIATLGPIAAGPEPDAGDGLHVAD